MKKFILSVALATALSSAAFAQSVGEQTGVGSALGIESRPFSKVMRCYFADKVWSRLANSAAGPE